MWRATYARADANGHADVASNQDTGMSVSRRRR
jgi:hypothetical protein